MYVCISKQLRMLLGTLRLRYVTITLRYVTITLRFRYDYENGKTGFLEFVD